MATTNYGRDSGSAHPLFGTIIDDELRGCTYNRTNDHLWAHTANFRGNDNGSNSTVRIGIYNVNSSKHPTTRKGYSALINVTSATEQDLSGAISTIDDTVPSGVTLTAIPLTDNTRYNLAILNNGATIDHAMQEASAFSADHKYFYYNFSTSMPPPSSFGSYTSSYEGHMTVWLTCEINEAPNAPTNLSPSGSINDTAPTFSADFTDNNSDYGDYLNQLRIQVRRQSDATSFWDTTVSSTESERTGAAISRAYGGTALVRGTVYEWRTQVSDHFGEWSDWTAWTEFTPANLGYITLDSDPTSKIEDNMPDFNGRWTHQSSTTMKTVMTRLLNAAGDTVLQTGADYNIADVASSASPGTLFTVAWADTGFTTLAWGTSYQYQMRGYDGSQWSDWSDARSFSTNAAPSIPANLDPANSSVLTDYPLLTCTATDADDTTGTGFTVYARIKNSSGTVLSTNTMTYNSGTGKWEFQTTATELATFATYKWDAYSYDGTLYSGEAGSSGDATKSSEAIFVFAEGPTVTITSPTEGATITTANLAVTWTTTDQQKYRVYLYADGTTTEVYDSGETVSTTSSHTIPSGYLRNDTSYDLVVWVEDSDPLEGTSAVRNFTVDYVEPDSVTNFQANAEKVTTDLWETAIRCTWDQTAYSTSVWQQYTLRRSAASGPDTSSIILARITSPSQTSYTDYLPASGVEYTYSMTQDILTGLDTLTSAAVEATAEIDLGGVVIVSVSSPSSVRTNLRYTAERDHTRAIDEAVYQPLSGVAPTTVRSPQYRKQVSFDAKIFDDDEATAAQRRDELTAIDEARGTCCYRDNHGRKYFCTLPDIAITDQVPDWYVAKIDGRQERYSEGVT